MLRIFCLRVRPAVHVLRFAVVASLFGLASGHVYAQGALPDARVLAKTVADRLDVDPESHCAAVGLLHGDDAPVLAFVCTRRAGVPADPIDLDSEFEIGSISKVFTGILLRNLTDQGVMHLDDPLSRYLGEAAIVPEREGRVITLRDLATHTAGLPRLPPEAGLTLVNPYSSIHEAELDHALAATKLASTPGTVSVYSNYGFMLLSLAESRAAHQSFASLMRLRIAEPLGMSHTWAAEEPGSVHHLVLGHDDRTHSGPRWDFDPDLAGIGGVHSSLGDMLIFARANLIAARQPQLAERAPYLAIRQAQEPLFSGGGASIGAAWNLTATSRGTMIWHTGATGGFRSFIGFIPELDTACVVLANSEWELDDLGFHLLDRDIALKVLRAAVTLDEDALTALWGDYEFHPGFVLHLSGGNGRIFAQASGQGSEEVFAESPDHFFYRAINAQFTIERDASGAVVGLRFVQGGGVVPARRVAGSPTLDLTIANGADYAGEYVLAPAMMMQVRFNAGHLTAQLAGQLPLEFFQRGDNLFAARSVEAHLRFDRASDGTITSVTLLQNGNELIARRVS